MSHRIERIDAALPPDFARLVEAAQAEGIRNMSMLLEEWEARTERFAGERSVLFEAWSGDTLIGIGGMTPETGLDQPAIRMRRFYVLPEFRKRGVAGELAETVMVSALAHVSTLTVNAAASPIAAPFWEAMDFIPVPMTNITHIYKA